MYSRLIKPGDLDHRSFAPMLGDKYKDERDREEERRKQQKIKQADLAIKDIEKAPEDHDWVNTPLYKQYYSDFSEIMSLMSTEFA